MIKSTATLIVVLLLGLVTACGSDEPTAPTGSAASTQGFNEADVQFATDMIPHHAQALEMVNLAIARDLSPQVQALADDIMAAQGPEITQMTTWLEDWDQPIPTTSLDHSEQAMGDMDMPGMASTEDMAALESAPDAEFEQMFLTMMTEHHIGAIEMAEAEIADGENAEAKQLAEEIIEGQQAEIDVMTELLAD